MKKKKLSYLRGQSLIEFSIFLGIFAAALISMQIYMQRGLQGRLRSLANQVSPRQYEANNTQSFYETTRTSSVVDSQVRGNLTRYMGAAPPNEPAQGSAEITTRWGWEKTEGE